MRVTSAPRCGCGWWQLPWTGVACQSVLDALLLMAPLDIFNRRYLGLAERTARSPPRMWLVSHHLRTRVPIRPGAQGCQALRVVPVHHLAGMERRIIPLEF